MTLNATRPKVPHICWSTTREAQISLRFALWSFVFQIIEVFDFSIGDNGEFEIFGKKSLKIGNLKMEAKGLGTLLGKMEGNDHIKLNNIEI